MMQHSTTRGTTGSVASRRSTGRHRVATSRTHQRRERAEECLHVEGCPGRRDRDGSLLAMGAIPGGRADRDGGRERNLAVPPAPIGGGHRNRPEERQPGIRGLAGRDRPAVFGAHERWRRDVDAREDRRWLRARRPPCGLLQPERVVGHLRQPVHHVPRDTTDLLRGRGREYRRRRDVHAPRGAGQQCRSADGLDRPRRQRGRPLFGSLTTAASLRNGRPGKGSRGAVCRFSPRL